MGGLGWWRRWEKSKQKSIVHEKIEALVGKDFPDDEEDVRLCVNSLRQLKSQTSKCKDISTLTEGIATMIQGASESFSVLEQQIRKCISVSSYERTEETEFLKDFFLGDENIMERSLHCLHLLRKL